MRKTTLIIGIVAGIMIAFLAGLGSTGTQTASADNGPHVATGSDATPDKCASCHRIHTGENEYLLKEAGSVEDFCYSCHGNGGPGSDLAVQEGTFYGEPDAAGIPYGSKTPSVARGLRAGGFEEARYDTDDPTQSQSGASAPTPVPVPVTIDVLDTKEAVNSRHNVDGTAGTMWGNGAIGTLGAGPSATLECTSCHDPHGNGNYRILRSIPTGSGGAGYAIPDTYGKTAIGYTTGNYFAMFQDIAGDGSPDATPVRYAGTAAPPAGASILVDTAKWCSQCHTRYLARGGQTVPPASDTSRVDSGDTIYTYRHTSAGWSVSNPTPAPTGVPQATPSVSYNNRACITCHSSHGSNAVMPGPLSSSVEYPDGTAPVAPDDRASMLKMNNRGMCRKCHSIYRVP